MSRRCHGILKAMLIAGIAVASLFLGAGRAAADVPRYGDSGPQVRAIQTKLISAGYLRAENNSGRFGSLTLDALRRVQRDYGLSPTGRYGPRTRVALRRAIA